MQVSRIPFESTQQFSGIFLDYIKGKKEAADFFSYTPHAESFRQVIEDRKKLPVDRQTLVNALKIQYKNFKKENNLLVFENIDFLANDTAFTVCTGHQLCLFTGPLYFLYKIISVIKLSEEIQKQYPSYRFVPVYWMASEDHDFEEINHLHLYGKKIEWKKAPEWQDRAVGSLPTSSIGNLIEELKNILGGNEKAEQILSTFRKAYLENENLASATRWLVNELFGKYGLVVLDGEDKNLKPLLKPVMQDDIFNHSNFRLVNERIAQLESKGYKAQVNPREINFFYFLGDTRGRIEKKGDAFHVLNTEKVFSSEEIKQEIEKHSERFSPNVVTRPLYQQHILPNLAYVGGPNELAYWFEYKSMFEHNKILFPMLVPRNSAVLMDGPITAKLSKFNLSIQELFEETEQLVKNFLSKQGGNEMDLSPEEMELKKTYSRIVLKVKNIDPTLEASVEAEFQKQVNFLSNLTSRLIRAEKQKQETSVNQVRKIKEKLFPGGSLQERQENFLPFYLQLGDSMFTVLKDSFQAFPDGITVIEI